MRAGTGEQGVFEHVDCRAELLPEGGPPQWIYLYTSRCHADTSFTCLSACVHVHLEFHFSPSIEVSVFCECRNEEQTAAFSHTRACDLTLLLTKRDQDSGFLCIICTFRSPQLRKSLSKLSLSQKIVDNGSGIGAPLRRERERLLKPLMQELNGTLPGNASSLGVILRAILLEEPMVRSWINKE